MPTRVHAQRFCCVNRVTHHVEVSDSREVMIFKTDTVHFGVGAGTHTDHHVAQFDVHAHSAAGADANDFLHAEIGDQLFGIDGAGWDTHTVAHHGDLTAFVSPGET